MGSKYLLLNLQRCTLHQSQSGNTAAGMIACLELHGVVYMLGLWGPHSLLYSAHTWPKIDLLEQVALFAIAFP